MNRHFKDGFEKTALSTSLLGAGLGAATGGAIGALSAEKGKRLKQGLVGGALGGLAGGLSGHLVPKHVAESREHFDTVVNKLQGAGYKITGPSSRHIGLL